RRRQRTWSPRPRRPANGGPTATAGLTAALGDDRRYQAAGQGRLAEVHDRPSAGRLHPRGVEQRVEHLVQLHAPGVDELTGLEVSAPGAHDREGLVVV